MLAPFEAPRLKLARAKQHLAELESLATAYLGTTPFEMIVEDHPDFRHLGSVVWTLRVRSQVPPMMSAVIGDIVHNLRTALDLVASDLVTLAGKSTKGVYFPISETEPGLDEMIKHKNFRRAGDDAVRLLKSLEPYKGGSSALRELHELDLKDKHVAIIPVGHGMSIDMSWLATTNTTPEGVERLKKWATKIDHDGQMAFVMLASHSPPVGTKIKANYVLALAHEGLVSGIELLTALKQLARVVEAVIDEFERPHKI